MGLDMYLENETYVGAHHEHRNVKGVIDISVAGKPVPVKFDQVSSIISRAGYWRKANQIHKWFVDKVQGGEDDCERYNVSWEQLQELKNLCLDVIATKDTSKLPPAQGFFFGPTDITDWYFQDLKETVAIIDSLDPNGDYYYRASW